ncbi:hypothetical protein FQZ97_1220030 [compost metagenome]
MRAALVDGGGVVGAECLFSVGDVLLVGLGNVDRAADLAVLEAERFVLAAILGHVGVAVLV